MQIPKASKLVLCEENSTDNILKLLRYYASSLDALRLESYCFGRMNHGTLGRTVNWNRMTRLEISFGFPSYETYRPPLDASQKMEWETELLIHLRTLGAFLASLQLRSLRFFELSMRLDLDPSMSKPITAGMYETPMAAFGTSLDKFMELHGPKLLNLKLGVPCSYHILNPFKHSGKQLRSLDLRYYNDPKREYDAFYQIRADPLLTFARFTNLVHLTLLPLRIIGLHHDVEDMYTSENERAGQAVATQLLTNNSRTLRSFTYASRRLSTLNWLIAVIANGELKLTSLTLPSVHFRPDTFTIGHHQLEPVIHFWLGVNVNVPFESRILWSDAALNWIRHTMPKLRWLTIKGWWYDRSPMQLAPLRSLIESTTSLRRTCLYAPKRWEPITKEAEDWILGIGGRVLT